MFLIRSLSIGSAKSFRCWRGFTAWMSRCSASLSFVLIELLAFSDRVLLRWPCCKYASVEGMLHDWLLSQVAHRLSNKPNTRSSRFESHKSAAVSSHYMVHIKESGCLSRFLFSIVMCLWSGVDLNEHESDRLLGSVPQHGIGSVVSVVKLPHFTSACWYRFLWCYRLA